jgi:poly(hydroxyalkanoate) depolymerase family esterase
MKNPFSAMQKATRLARRGRPLSAALLLQKALLPSAPASPKRKAAPRKSGTSRPPRPQPGSVVEDQYSCAQGRVRYRLYTPVGSARRRMPLIVMLHGCTQNAFDFATGTAMDRVADELGFCVLYPEQSPAANPNRCWNWHRPANQKRGGGEAAVIAGLTRHAADLCRANPDRIYIAGLSAGGAAAAIIGAAYPTLYAAVGVHSGVPLGTISSVSDALAAMRGQATPPVGRTPAPPPMILFHGDQDRVVHPSNAAAFVTRLRQSSRLPLIAVSRPGEAPGGRAYTRTLYHRAGGPVLLEEWTVHGSGHAWSGGHAPGSHVDPKGPDASRAMADFFLARRRQSPPR